MKEIMPLFDLVTRDLTQMRQNVHEGQTMVGELRSDEKYRAVARPQLVEDLSRFPNSLNPLVENLLTRVGELQQSARSDRPDEKNIQERGFAIQTAIGVLRSRLEWFGDELSNMEQMASTAQPVAAPPPGKLANLRSWLSSLWAKIKQISQALWHIISGLLTPKGWTLKGDIGTGPLGLANVGIEITFGQ